MQFRIGRRDPETGLYYVIHPDGSELLNGIKIFNAAYTVGDSVLATQRSDGMMILDGVNAVEDVPSPSPFNDEEEEILPTISIDFAPGSLTEVIPLKGYFVIRIKVNRPQRQDLRVKCKFSGTAPRSDYTYYGLDNDLVAIIPAGKLFFDFRITPVYSLSRTSRTVIVTLLPDRKYRLGAKKSVTAKIKPMLFYKYTVYVYKDIVRSLFYRTNEITDPNYRNNFYSYTEATNNAGIFEVGIKSGEPTIGAPLASDYIRVGDFSIRYQQFAARMYTPIYTKESPIAELPHLYVPGSTYMDENIYGRLTQDFFTPADQSPDIDLPIYRYLTGLSTSPAGDSCPATYTPPLPLINSSDVFQMVGLTDFPASYTVLSRGTYWVHFIVDPSYVVPQRNFIAGARPSFSFTREAIPPIAD